MAVTHSTNSRGNKVVYLPVGDTPGICCKYEVNKVIVANQNAWNMMHRVRACMRSWIDHHYANYFYLTHHQYHDSLLISHEINSNEISRNERNISCNQFR